MKMPLTYEELLQGCESEDLHLSGAIQPFGALVIVKRSTNKIIHASANLKEFVDLDANSVLETFADTPEFDLSKLTYLKPSKIGFIDIYPNFMKVKDATLDAALSFDGDNFIIELEKNPNDVKMSSIYKTQLEILTPPDGFKEFESYKQNFTDEIQALIDFDRVMIYRFHDDWSGEVICESAKEDIGNYLGLRFPASDIPAIARKIYLLNPYRMIPDIKASPCNIITQSHEIADLTYSNLRSVSYAHLEYLANMGVQASFSLPLKKSGELWGLVACHNFRPKYISLEKRAMANVLAQSFSMSLANAKASSRFKMIETLDNKIENLIKNVTKSENLLDGIQDSADELLTLLSASGMAIVNKEEIILIGQAPNIDVLTKIDSWFINECKDLLFASDSLSKKLDIKSELACGVLCVKIESLKSKIVRMYWFRPEKAMEIAWAGAPNKPLAEDVNAKALSPRKSFEKWVEVTKELSEPWSVEHKIIAGKLASQFLRWI